MEAEHTDNTEDYAVPYDMHTFREWVIGIRQQIDQMKEQISNTYATARSANMGVSGCERRISKLEDEREATTQATQATTSLPDSNGFWRDAEGDIWAYDGNPDHHPIYLFDNDLQEVCDNQPHDPFPWEIIKLYAPFTKIRNPFPTGEDND